jgi:hypothetical protein
LTKESPLTSKGVKNSVSYAAEKWGSTVKSLTPTELIDELKARGISYAEMSFSGA